MKNVVLDLVMGICVIISIITLVGIVVTGDILDTWENMRD